MAKNRPQPGQSAPTSGAIAPPSQATVNRVVLRAPIGAKFSFWGNDMYLEFQRGKEVEVADFLENWVKVYLRPMAIWQKEFAERQVAEFEAKQVAAGKAVDPILALAKEVAAEDTAATIPAAAITEDLPPDSEDPEVVAEPVTGLHTPLSLAGRGVRRGQNVKNTLATARTLTGVAPVPETPLSVESENRDNEVPSTEVNEQSEQSP